MFERYHRHLESIRAHLPRAVIELDASHTLHDSEVKTIINDFAVSQVRFTLQGWDTSFQIKTRYDLTFSEVVLFEQHFPPEEYVESELGDLGYWEWDLVPEGTELRMLFASSAEFRLIFRGLSFTHEAAEA